MAKGKKLIQGKVDTDSLEMANGFHILKMGQRIP